MLRFQWDEHNRAHIAHHGIVPEEAEYVILHDPFDLEVQIEDDEERFVQVGATKANRILIVITTWRGKLVRVITAFDALRAMKVLYIAQGGKCSVDKTLKVPHFVSEGDEAQWWVDNQDLLVQQFQRAAAEGTLTRGTMARRGSTPTTTIRLDPSDISKARLMAERRGLKYQTYLKMLIHEALQKEEQVAG